MTIELELIDNPGAGGFSLGPFSPSLAVTLTLHPTQISKANALLTKGWTIHTIDGGQIVMSRDRAVGVAEVKNRNEHLQREIGKVRAECDQELLELRRDLEDARTRWRKDNKPKTPRKTPKKIAKKATRRRAAKA